MQSNDACMQIGLRIRKIRTDQKLTQGQLAQKAGCSQRFVSELERGKTTVELGKVVDVLAALDCQLAIKESASKTNGSLPRLADYL